jgi:hypothetical protein
MSFEPQRACRHTRIDASRCPPSRLVTIAMDFAMMAAAEGYGKFVACLAAKCARLGKTNVVRIRRRAPANQAGLLRYEQYVLAVAKSARLRMGKFAFVNSSLTRSI